MAEQDGFGGGIEAAQLQLEALGKRIIEAMPEAVAAGAEILQREAVALAPKATMELANSASNRPVEEGNSNFATHQVSFDAPHAIVQEFGIKVSRIVPVKKESLRLGGPGGDHAMGVPPGRTQSYLRPAAENNKQDIEDAIQKVLDREIGKAIVQYRGVMTSK